MALTRQQQKAIFAKKKFDKGLKQHIQEQQEKGKLTRVKILNILKNSQKPINRFTINDRLGGGALPEIRVLEAQGKIKMLKSGNVKLT